MKFEDMNIEKSVLGSLSDIGFENPTRIQSEAIPVIKEGYDVIGQSETGSGKTAAFGIPLVEKVTKSGNIQALVLAPTRELCLQIAEELEKFSRFKGLSVQAIYGGVPMEPQILGLRKADIVVGTPGRVIDHMMRGNLNFSNLKIFVMDEADKMIDMGFVEAIEEIEKNIPKNRQTLMFSATMPENLMKISEKFTRNARKIKTNPKVRDDKLKQFYCDVKPEMKFSVLVHLINQEQPKLAIVFCNSRREVDEIAENLKENGINASALHGGLSQERREKTISNFHKGMIKVLVATDIAGRGLDIKNVTHIFNYRIPKNLEDYVNRIGRTARAGETGKAISILSREDYDSFRKIINKYSYDVSKMEVSGFKMLKFKKQSFKGIKRFGKKFQANFSKRKFGNSFRKRLA